MGEKKTCTFRDLVGKSRSLVSLPSRRGMASINWMQHHPLHRRTPDLVVFVSRSFSLSLRRTTS